VVAIVGIGVIRGSLLPQPIFSELLQRAEQVSFPHPSEPAAGPAWAWAASGFGVADSRFACSSASMSARRLAYFFLEAVVTSSRRNAACVASGSSGSGICRLKS